MRLLLPLALLACGGGSTEPASTGGGPDAEAAEVAAGRLCALYTRVGDVCEWSGNSAVIGDRTLLVTAEVLHEARAGSLHSLELAYDLSIDGKPVPALRGRAVGSGASRTAAHDMAADDWARVFGSAIVDQLRHTGKLAVLQSLQDSQSPPPAFPMSEWVAYPGFTDLRGKRTEAKMIDLQEVLTLVEPATTSWGEGHHALHIEFTRAGTAFTDPQCTLDGRESPEVCELAKGYGWPDGSYLLKQYFAFNGDALPDGVEARKVVEEE